MKLQWLT